VLRGNGDAGDDHADGRWRCVVAVIIVVVVVVFVAGVVVVVVFVYFCFVFVVVATWPLISFLLLL